MATFVNDTFSGMADGQLLSTRSGEVGATWTQTQSGGVDPKGTVLGRCYTDGAGYVQASGTPSSADYSVFMEIEDLSGSGTINAMGIAGRYSSPGGINTGYVLRCADNTTTFNFLLYRIVSGAATLIATGNPITRATGVVKTLELRMTGTSIRCFWDGAEMTEMAVTDSGVSQVGNVAIRTVSQGNYLTGIQTTRVYAIDGSGTIGLTDPVANRVYQRNGTTRSMSISGTYTGAVPASVQAQIVKDSDSSVVQAWTTLTGATISGGTWSGTVSVPASANAYRINVRGLDSGSNVIATANGTNAWLVGDVFLLAGSSTMTRFTSDGAVAVTAASRRYSAGAWGALSGGNSGDGCAAFVNAYGPASGVAVGIIDAAAAGTVLSGWAAADASYVACRNAAQAQGASGIAGVICHVGSNDAGAGTIASVAAHLGLYRTLISNMRTDLGMSTLKWYITGCNRRTAGTDAQFDMAREAEKQLGNDSNVAFACYSVDQSLNVDGIHLSNAGMAVLGTRVAASVIAVAASGQFRGPSITGAAFTSGANTTIRVSLAHRAGTDITPATGITGFAVTDSGGAKTISSAVRVNATSIDVTVSAACTGATTLTYHAGVSPIVTSPVLDNSSNTLPMESAASSSTLNVIPFSTSTPSNRRRFGLGIGSTAFRSTNRP
jgi:lysophospholipase L1-like esterase